MWKSKRERELESRVETLRVDLQHRIDQINRRDLDEEEKRKRLIMLHNEEIAKLTQAHEHKLRDIEKDREIERREAKFAMEHAVAEGTKELIAENIKFKQENAVLKKENLVMEKVVNINKDIVDVKELVRNLVQKLPTIDLKSLSITNNGKK